MARFTRFFGRTIGEGVGYAVGGATQAVIDPILQEYANEGWASHPDKPLDALTLAQGDAQGQIPHDWAVAEAARTGFDGERYGHLLSAFNTGPGVAQAYNLWHRELLSDDEFKTALVREGIETTWINALVAAKNVLLTPEEIANAIQQGFLAPEGILPGADLDGPPFAIPTEQVGIDASDEARHSGVTAERLKVLAQLSGNPPGPMELNEMFNRGLITEAQWLHGLREGRTKTKWSGPIFALRRAVLSAVDAANLRLRGWISKAEAEEIGARTGYNPNQMQLLYEMRGRPISPTQAYVAWARDAPHVQQPGFDPSGPDFGEDDFLRAIRQSDIRPEWGPILWHNRFAYPSLFQLRRAVQDGGISRARALTILRYQRYEEADRIALVNSWLRGSATTAKGLTAADLAAEYEGLYLSRDEYVAELQTLGYEADEADGKANVVDARRVRQARNQAIQRIRTVYVGHKIQRDEAVTALDREGIPPPAHDMLLREWDNEREVNVSTLTPAQVKKAFTKSIRPREWAVAELTERGYTTEDASIYLDE